VAENVYTDNIDLLGNVYLDTIDSIRCRIFLEFSNLARKNVIIFGPRGSGKSKLLQEFVQEFGKF
jgi:type IV secretory pathway ATPase VirB11/archaellum biosynthesis ATPase